ncbi:MAG: hypothetical protein J0M17_09925 [Planctomycetes bacterium]|nr:hypothetical protein [Planctomycetota bacterium]
MPIPNNSTADIVNLDRSHKSVQIENKSSATENNFLPLADVVAAGSARVTISAIDFAAIAASGWYDNTSAWARRDDGGFGAIVTTELSMSNRIK